MRDPDRLSARLTSRKFVILYGRAQEGVPIIGTEDTEEETQDGLCDTSITALSYCGGCHAALHEPGEVAAGCVVCATILCPSCAAIRCLRCAKSVCPEDRLSWGTSVMCRSDFYRQALGLGVAVVVALVVITGLFLGFARFVA